jgi:protein AroM
MRDNKALPDTLEKDGLVNRRIGILTLGQSPRDDVVPMMQNILGPRVAITQAGALDGLTDEEITALAPFDNEVAYVSRLRDGRGVELSKARLIPFVDTVGRGLASRVDAIVLLCSGDFTNSDLGVPTIYPDQILKATIDAWLTPQQVLGVVSPLSSQTDLVSEKWSTSGKTVVGATASPYHDDVHFHTALCRLLEREPDLILLDCMGFAPRHRAIARKITSCPVLVPSAFVANMVKEIVI